MRRHLLLYTLMASFLIACTNPIGVEPLEVELTGSDPFEGLPPPPTVTASIGEIEISGLIVLPSGCIELSAVTYRSSMDITIEIDGHRVSDTCVGTGEPAYSRYHASITDLEPGTYTIVARVYSPDSSLTEWEAREMLNTTVTIP